ncbi:MAG: carbamoyl-phosphate synthase (glutamine-hydrolyzing) large subunit [candidate division KSB1 bacterium]|nr:carbamoyl-phosphate synthase (glutamine-hydrolyzing) large subunit [candidate division KSB1 bacterium]MDZ7364482.1 carbamoyl-phosphate synthase (glutamine-hydrolyzing) large subunit [candidate division KSB1 bacterium]MDZ7402854.1 carbamoyl-phosphate synthase (glutamine-hydrolyzing) large subunit [candidate division KSB1 bacterium]
MHTPPQKIILLGSSALKIGEAGEFDYSGSQAIKALKQENIATILINPNIATIQTSEHLADKVYFLPVNPYFVEKIIQKEKPDGILLGFGGQTALNCGVALAKSGVFEKYNLKVLGTPISAIEATEDRQIFADKLREIGVKVPRSVAVTSRAEAIRVAHEIGFPVMIRIAYALGGLGSGLCTNEQEVSELADKAFAYTNQILVEEYLKGWKEIEYEVVRDSYDNCITVCNMENFDPLGIHTGESIVVAPSQTLSNNEYHKLREIAIRVIRHLGIVGECNIQYALDPKSEDYRVIEVNARLSRSSALASKATGYPLAFIAAKLALGHSLVDLKNQITQTTMACFEPALDYVVVKIPRWDLKKFRNVSKRLGSGMKSVGEVMAIGRNFEEALQKALRMLEIGVHGLIGNDHLKFGNLEEELQNPTDERVFAIPLALRAGFSIDRIHELTHIDKWFLYKIKNVLDIAEKLKVYAGGVCPKGILRDAKKAGFSDAQVAKTLGAQEPEVRAMRRNYGLAPVVKQIDTLAAEYPAQTNFLYLTYNGSADDVTASGKKSVIVLGSGVYRIGSSVEFDWCCVNAVMTLKKLGYHTVMINYNPETVSTDYDECDRLYFEELRLETIAEIYEKEQALGIIIAMGGQTPNNLALKLREAGMKILGTSPEMIDRAEDRHKFSSLLDQLGIDQPVWQELSSLEEAKAFAQKVEYPVLVRPSYVLSGSAMSVAVNDNELVKFLDKATAISAEHPVVISKFIENAKEIEFDGVAKAGEVLVYAISEHVENAGVHSGDATLVLPPQHASLETIRRVRMISKKIAAALEISGPFNIQFITRDNDVKVIECNLRASRSFPFVSKVYKTNFIDLATRVIMNAPAAKFDRSFMELEYVGVKAPQFSFTRLQGADPTLGVEMSSTGEVGCLGDDFAEAFLKAMLSVGYKLPIRSVLLSTGPLEGKAEFVASAKALQNSGVRLYATRGTAEFMRQYGIETEVLNWPTEKASPNVLEYLTERKIDLVINIPKNYQEEELTNDYIIRRKAVDFAIPLITELHLAKRFAETIVSKSMEDLQIKSWEEYGG